MNKIVKIVALALFINSSGFIITGIKAEELSTQEKRHILLGAAIGLTTGSVTALADILVRLSPFSTYLTMPFPLFSWYMEMNTREKTVKKLVDDSSEDDSSKAPSRAAWIGSWVGYLAAQQIILNLIGKAISKPG